MPFYAGGSWHPNNQPSAAFATEAQALAAEGGAPVQDDPFALAPQPSGQGRASTDLRSQSQRNPGSAPASSPTPTKPRPPEKLDANGNIVGKWQWTGTDWVHTSPQQAFESGNIGGAGGAYNAVSDEGRAVFDESYRNNQGFDFGGFARDALPFVVDPIGSTARLAGGRVAQAASGPVGALMALGGTEALQWLVPGGGSGGSSSTPRTPTSAAPLPKEIGAGGNSANTDLSLQEQNESESEYDQTVDEGQRQIDEDRNRFLDALNGLDRDTSLSDASRADQIVARDAQRDLLNRILGFDPNAYADQFSDNALAAQTALARSAPGGAAGRQAALFNAQEQAPGIQAEAQRQAQQLENQRLNAAQAAVGKLGDLAYGVRAQDSQREEFDAEFEKGIADSFGDIFKTDSSTAANFANISANVYTSVLQATVNYAQMDSEERRSLWDYELRSRGLDNELEQIRRQYPDKDPIDVWLDRVSKVGAGVVAAKTGGLL